MSKATSQQIPIRRIQITSPNDLPSDYGTTPGGTMFSTTPGGTRIIYDRSFLLKCRASPMSNTPPNNLPDIPGVTSPEKAQLRHPITDIKEEQEIRSNANGGKGVSNMHILYGLDPNLAAVNSGGPLQQYRHRNFVQQSTALYERMCQQVANIQEVFKQVALQNEQSNSVVYVDNSPRTPRPIACEFPRSPAAESGMNNNNSSGDGVWQVDPNAYAAGPVHKRSQLQIWREAKMSQAAQAQQQVAPQIAHQQLLHDDAAVVAQHQLPPPPPPPHMMPGHPGMPLHGLPPMCNPMEMYVPCTSMRTLPTYGDQPQRFQQLPDFHVHENQAK